MQLSVLLDQRRLSQTVRGKRDDDAHVALVVECGGMRGVAASGAFRAIRDAGLKDAFDTVHGSSAGACAAAYFFTGQFDDGRAIYLEDICNRRVINPYRLLSRPCMVDTDYIADEIIGRKRLIETDKFRAHPGAFRIVTSAVSDGRARVLMEFNSLQDVIDALRASLRVPGVNEPGVRLNNEMHLDGGLVAPIALQSAISAGATHVVVVGTQRAHDGAQIGATELCESRLMRLLYGSPLMEGYLQGQAARRAVYSATLSASGPEILLLARPQEAEYCAWHTIDTTILRAVEAASEAAAGKILAEVLINGRSSP